MPFTIDGSEAFEQRIQQDMDRIRDAAVEAVGPQNLTALVLGGGYGRGEGGVYTEMGEERVYNDYDFFVVVPFRSRRRRKWVARQLDGVKERLEPECGVHVDFSPPMPAMDLPRLRYELMFMEAKQGHQVLYGPPDVFDAIPAFDPARPPLEECSRLFMNRSVGLIFAGDKLRRQAPLDREGIEFVVRNIYKAFMAMGDSVLFREGRYSPSYITRLANFEQVSLDGIPHHEELAELYRSSIAFKLRPRHDIPESMTLPDWHAFAVSRYLEVFLWFERVRLNRPEMDWSEYTSLPARLSSPSGIGLLRCLVQNLRYGRGLSVASECILQPRDRILKRLPALLQQPGGPDSAPVLKLWSHIG